jgi:hypothetical protein
MKDQTLFKVYQGDDFAARFTVTDEANNPSDITNWGLEVTLKRNPLTVDTDAELYIPSLTIYPADAVLGTFYIVLDKTLTAGLSQGHYYLNLRRQLNGKEITLLNGRISVLTEAQSLVDILDQTVRVQLDQPEGSFVLDGNTVPAEALDALYATRDAVEADRAEVATNKAATDANVVAAQASEDASAVSETNADNAVVATGADLVATNQDTIDTAADLAATHQDTLDTAADRFQTNLDRVDTSADAVQTGLDRVATNQDTLDTAADAAQTGIDRSATGDDATATAADRVVTQQDSDATATDRVATGQDRTAADSSASSALASENKSEKWAEELEDVAVETGQYSSLHHAIKSEDSAIASALSETNAGVSATNASGSETAAALSETNASGSESAASLSAGNAATSETNASGSASAASSSATAAQTAETGAVAAKNSAESLFDQFGDQYLGDKASDPTVDNDGNALVTGAVYFNTTDNFLKFYSGSFWVAPEDVATTAATAAKASETAAAASQTASSTSETNASGSASAAYISEGNAGTSETNAGNSETAALGSQNKANQWAEALENTAVETGKFSALHHAAKASASETASKTSETNATGSASAAATSKTNAATSASNASTSATNATTSETKADNWANAAVDVAVETGKFSGRHYASKGGASATAASTSETNAATSETNAGGSASNASTSASNAATSASNSSGSASAASTSATNAASSLTTFQNQYHGPLASAPTVNVTPGDLYFNTVANEVRVYSGTAWLKVAGLATTEAAGSVEKATFAEAESGTADKYPDASVIQLVGDNRYEPRISANMVWDPTSDVYSRYAGSTGVTQIHERMRRCLLNDDGTVNYYLSLNDSTLKADGTAAVLDGTDGQVMVEIPKCYVRVSTLFNGDVKREISDYPRSGFVLHPAFAIGGTLQRDPAVDMWYYTNPSSEKQAIYVGAYHASVYDTSGLTYIDGLNLDNNDSRVDYTADVLGSVSGKYPMVGVTRAQMRQLASNRGSNWSQMTFWQWSLIKLLFFVEYGGFDGQALLAAGNNSVSTGYPASSSSQTDSPHSVAGKSNIIGNGSGGVVSSVRDTAWMNYRGIENFWGNAWQFCDGFNVNARVWYVSNDIASFVDDTTVGYTQLGVAAPGANGYIRNVQHNTLGDVVTDSSGNSSTAFADYYYQSSGWRMALVGGSASHGADVGPSCVGVTDGSGLRYRGIAGRLAFSKIQ